MVGKSRALLLLLLYYSPVCATSAVLGVIVGVFSFRELGILGAALSLLLMLMPSLISLFGGVLSDKIGREKYALIASNIASSIAVGAMAFVNDIFLLFALYAAVQLIGAFTSPVISAYIREVLGDYTHILKFRSLSRAVCSSINVAAAIAAGLLLLTSSKYAIPLFLLSAALTALSTAPLLFLDVRGRPRGGATLTGIFGAVRRQLESDPSMRLLFLIYMTTGIFSMPPLLLWIYDYYGNLELGWSITLVLMEIGGALGGLLSARVGTGDFFRIALALPLPALITGAMPLVTKEVIGFFIVLAALFIEQILHTVFSTASTSYITAYSRREAVATTISSFLAVQTVMNMIGLALWSAVATYIYPPYVMIGGMSAELVVLALLLNALARRQKPPQTPPASSHGVTSSQPPAAN
ncbi:MAG: MFS transporter [Pyrobaculum sp.]|jgi:MFS family permease